MSETVRCIVMRILLASSEVHPYSKTGGLADMAGSLAKALARAGHTVGVVTPLYRGLRERFPEMRKIDWYLNLSLGTNWVRGEIWTLEPAPGLTVYFVEQPGYFDRAGVYAENGLDFADNAERFIFLSKAVVHLARHLPWQPQAVHVNDWQTALVPLLMLQQKLWEGWANMPRTCLTIHNLAYQGIFPVAKYALTNLPQDYFNLHGAEFYGNFNFLKTGIVYADAVTTVSPRYAREITTPEQGCGLDDMLRRRQGALFGILNGVDYEEWNTTANPMIKHAYSPRNLKGKTENKTDLQQELELPVDETIPMFSNITRLADQKGVDIQLGALEEMLSTRMQFVLLGSGWDGYEAGVPPAGEALSGQGGGAHRVQPGAVASHRGRKRFFPDAVAIRAVRVEPDAQPALWNGADCAHHRRTGRHGGGHHRGPETRGRNQVQGIFGAGAGKGHAQGAGTV